MSGRYENLIGRKFNKLTVVGRAVNDTKRQNAKWLCVCECGNSKEYITSRLKSGDGNSCGCDTFEKRSKSSSTHGLSKLRQYHTWVGMNDRCYNQNEINYQNYGGRGLLFVTNGKMTLQRLSSGLIITGIVMD